MARNLIARLYDALNNGRPQAGTANLRKWHPVAECLESRVTPSTSSVLLPAFYQDLLNRTPDYPAASGYANAIRDLQPVATGGMLYVFSLP